MLQLCSWIDRGTIELTILCKTVSKPINSSYPTAVQAAGSCKAAAQLRLSRSSSVLGASGTPQKGRFRPLCCCADFCWPTGSRQKHCVPRRASCSKVMYSFTRGPNMPNFRHIRAYCRMGAYIRELCNGCIGVSGRLEAAPLGCPKLRAGGRPALSLDSRGPAHAPFGQVHLLEHAERLRPAEGALQDPPADGMRLAQHHGPLLPLSALCLC
jgi:hypothetical protein